MSIIEKYIQQTKDQNGNAVGFGFKGNIQNLIQEVEDLEASMVNEKNFNTLKEENALLHGIISKEQLLLTEVEIFIDNRCDICRDVHAEWKDCNVCWKKDVKEIIAKQRRILNADKT